MNLAKWDKDDDAKVKFCTNISDSAHCGPKIISVDMAVVGSIDAEHHQGE
jgi:hypothetical protein